mmetsp:Transcript_72786/g.136008  ORF Transcript_72786/g.136008 Transcript_72786/m.136008 type:complete len:273 (-) Transcript_72786:126-944(-)
MSEIRHRGGGASGSGDGLEGLTSLPGEGKLSPEDIQEWINASKREPKPGLSDAAKAAKDALEGDPFNMDLILKLGIAYMQDDQWDRCANVLIRGMKRMGEFKDLERRNQFGTLLCHASMQTNRYQQALAVLQDMEQPHEKEKLKAFSMLACKVYCYNKRAPDALKALSVLVEGEKGQTLASTWAVLAASFKHAGVYEAAKSCVMKQLRTDEEKKKLEAMETLMQLKDTSTEVQPSFFQSNAFKVCLAVMAVMLIFVLFKLESDSLSKLSPKK